MEKITNKKQLLEVLSDWVPSRVDRDGIPAATSLFNSMDSDRAYQLNTNILENIAEELSDKKGSTISPQGLIKVAARNLELNSDEELLHFMWQCGIIYNTILEYDRRNQSKPPFIGEN